jgi:GNAT superfamily N-acetyltransferase
VLQAVFVAAGREAWAHILGPDALAALSPPERWRGRLGGGAVLVAETEAEGDGVGFSVTVGTEVDAFYTDPSVWGTGVGRKLMRATLAALAAAGHAEAYLWTAERNDRPRRFYERDGWRLEGTSRERELRGSEFVELRYPRVLP